VDELGIGTDQLGGNIDEGVEVKQSLSQQRGIVVRCNDSAQD
jgi:hypothetical protein